MYKIINFTLLSALVLSSCSFNGEHSGIKYPENRIITNEVTVNTRDNLNIKINFYVLKDKARSPAVVLLHMLGKDSSSWNNFIPLLLDQGYAVLNVDLRGHGRSVKINNGRKIFYNSMSENDWQKLPDDIIDIVNFVSHDKYVDSDKIALIGASIGANSSIIAGSNLPDKIKTVVAISPGLDYHGIQPLSFAENLSIPLLVAVSKGDRYSFESSNQLNEVVKSPHDLLVYNDEQHGTNLLFSSQELQGKIINWLNEYLKK